MKITSTSLCILLHSLIRASMSTGQAMPHSPPVFILRYQPNDVFQGFYTITTNFSIGSPGSDVTLAFDTATADVFVNSAANKRVDDLCIRQTPIDTCMGTYDNSSSTTYKNLGHNTYIYQGGIETGDYFSDIVRLGPYTIRKQVMAAGLDGVIPFNELGTGFPQNEVGVTAGTFPRYSTALESMQQQGLIKSTTQSFWLNPEGNDPAAFPDGKLMFGALDTSLYEGRLVTVPVVHANTTQVVKEPTSWNIALTGLRVGGGKSLVADPTGDSCMIFTGEAQNAFPPATFQNLVAAYPTATLNSTTKFYDIACDQRYNTSNSWSFTISDPRNRENGITIEVPSTQTIWPSNLVVNGGDPTTCSIAANTFPVAIGGNKYKCALGASFLKSTYMVLDMDNREVTIARAARGYRRSNIVEIPKEGIRGLRF